MNLLDSLLDAIVRLDGDALVMHVGEKPYVVTTSQSLDAHRGPLAWGQVELSSRVLTPHAVLGMLGQILPLQQRQDLEEMGAIEHELPAPAGMPERFTVVAARGGDDVWLEVRRRTKEEPAAAAVAEPLHVEEPLTVAEDVAPEPVVEAPRVDDAVTLAAAHVIAAPQETARAEQAERSVSEVVEVRDETENEEVVDEPDEVLEIPLDSTAAAPEEIVAPPLVGMRSQSAPTDEEVNALLATMTDSPDDVAVDSLETADFEIDDATEEEEVLDLSELAPAASATYVEAPPFADDHLELRSPVEEPALKIEVTVVGRDTGLAVTTTEVTIETVAEEPSLELMQARSDEPLAQSVPHSAVADLEVEIEPAGIAEVHIIQVSAQEPTVDAPQPVEHAQERLQPVAATGVGDVGTEMEPGLVAEAAPAPDTWQPHADAVADAGGDHQQIIAETHTEAPSVVYDAHPESILAAVASHAEHVPIARELADVVEEPAFEPDVEMWSDAQREPAGVAPVVADALTERESVAAEPVLPVAAMSVDASADPAVSVESASEVPVGESQRETIPAAAAVSTEVATEMSKAAEPAPAARETASELPLEEARPALVVPISRSSVRSESPVPTSPTALAPVEHMLRIAAGRGAATVYVVAHSKPMIRVDGEISALEGEPTFSTADVERLVMDLAPARGRDVQAGPVEWMTDVAEVGRVRCVTFREHRGPGVIFRMIPPRAISADQLGLPAEVLALCAQPDGLVLVTGARASGKSTLLSAFVDLINRTRSDHVISVESQINFVHESRKSFVSQREVRGDAEAAAAAVRSAFREDPDVLVIEDLRTAEIVSVALEAAESGRLVLGSLSAPSTVAAIERLVELFSPERRAHAQTSLAGALRGIVAQVLLRKIKGGRIVAREVLLNTPAVSSLILEGRTFQLPVALDAGRRHGMVPLTDSLATLVREGTVHVAEAYRKALDREALLAVLKRDGIDTSFAERLA